MLSLDPMWLPTTQQRNFRLLLDAMARPGTCHTLIDEASPRSAVLAVLATLLDTEVSLADPYYRLGSDDWPMLQTHSAAAEQADYILCDASHTPCFTPKLGTLPSPEQSATLILVVEALDQGDTHLQLSGPGIADITNLLIKGLHPHWLAMREDWVCAFPLGVDLFFVDERQIAALPRTTKVEIL